MSVAYLAIDQSTSASKVVVFAENGNVLATVSRAHRQIYPRAGWVEHDAEEIAGNVLGAAAEAVSKLPRRGEEIEFISITNQRETIVLFDRDSGRCSGNAIVWQDRRADAICRQLSPSNEHVAAKTGLKIDSYFSGPKLAWIMQNDPTRASLIRKGRVSIGTIDAFLVQRLTGGGVFATDTTNASRTLLFDIGGLRWDDELCALFGVPMSALPQVRDGGDSFGSTNLGGALPRAVPIRGVMGDSQAALFAHRCHSIGHAKVTLGTGSSVLLHAGETFTPTPGLMTTLASSEHGRGRYCTEGIVNFAAATIAWLRDQLGLIRDVSEVEPLARSVPDNGGVYLVPAFTGLSSPHWSPSARAAVVGLSAHSTKAHVVRAALEAIAYQIRDALGEMATTLGATVSSLHVDGGASRNTFLTSFLADQVGVPLRVATMPECSAFGAVLVGLRGQGRPWSDLPGDPASKLVEPAANRDVADANYAGWRRAVRQVLAGAAPR